MPGDESINHTNILIAAVEIGVSKRAAKREGAIQTDVAHIQLFITLKKNCHFDRREKSALLPLKAHSRFLPAVEMTVIVWRAYQRRSHPMPDVDFVSLDNTG